MWKSTIVANQVCDCLLVVVEGVVPCHHHFTWAACAGQQSSIAIIKTPTRSADTDQLSNLSDL